MMPLLMKMRVPRKNGKWFTLYLPIFLIWIILLLLFILIFPILLIILLLAFILGFGWIGLRIIPIIVNTFWNLHGLEIEIQSSSKVGCVPPPKKSFGIKFI